MGNLHRSLLLALAACSWNAVAGGGESRLSDEPIPFQAVEDYPKLTPPLFELGDVFLRPGNIKPGFEIPTGAVWQPRFWVFGTLRSSLQTFEVESNSAERITEWANRLDLFGNLQLTGTERLLVGLQPLHQNGRFTGITLEPDNAATDNDWRDETNLEVQTLFFEGDFGEIFPGLDRHETKRYDWGFSVGRQPLSFQDGLLLNDTQDTLGLTRNSLKVAGWDWLTNLRLTFLYSWNRVGSAATQTDDGAQMLGLFTAWDTVFGNRFASTVELDLAYVSSDGRSGDLLVAGFGATQRFGSTGSTVRIVGSKGLDDAAPQSSDGVLGFVEFSKSPYHSNNLMYANAFWAVDDFTSAARGPDAGGPLGRVGLLFAARGIGRYPAPLSNAAGDAFGAAFGYQMFFDQTRRQLIVETGGRFDRGSGGDNDPAGGLGLRLRQAVGRRMIIDLDGFLVGSRMNGDSLTDTGARLELLWKL